MPAVASASGRSARSTTVSFGPFVGTFDPSDPGASRKNRLFDSVNLTVLDIENGAAAVARHGMVGLSTRLTYTDAQGNTQATGQGIYYFRALNGNTYTFVFCGGRMYSWDGSDTLWPGTDITPGGVVIDATNPIFCVTYNDQLVVSDEQNPPWVYNPTTTATTVIDLDGAGSSWCTKGGPVIYSGKVFFILRLKGSSYINTDPVGTMARITTDGATTAGDRHLVTELTSGFQNTIVWCEELQPTVGYMQTGYTDYWTLTQTASEILGGLAADEGILIYFRTMGIGSIVGAVNTDFRASATRDTISSTIGTNAPAAMCFVNRKVYFVDMDGRPHRVLTGGGGEPERLWLPLRRTVEGQIGSASNRDNVAANARAWYHESYDLVLMTIWDRQTIYAFHADSGIYVGQWVVCGTPGSSVYVDAMGSYLDSSGRWVFAFLGTRGTTYSSSTQGVFWRQKFASDTNRWLDEATQGSTTTALYRAAETHWLTSSAAFSYRAHRMEVQVVGDSSGHAIGLQYITNVGASSVITATSSSVTGEKAADDSIATARWAFGPNAQAGAMRFRFVVTHTDNVRFGLHNGVVDATILKARPKAA